MKEETISSRRIYDGRVVALRLDTVELPNGATTEREIVEHPGAVAVVALDGEGKVYLVRQYRKPAEEALLEIPAGTREAGENAAACARRELQEEIGFRPGRLERLTGFYTSPGFCTEYIDVYLATELSASAQPSDADETIEVVSLPLDEALQRVRREEIRDAKSVVGILSVALRQSLAGS